jgi:DNA-binding Xre family transcriptional regulator
MIISPLLWCGVFGQNYYITKVEKNQLLHKKIMPMKPAIYEFHNRLAKLGKGENLTTDVLLKICNVFNCDIADIMEIERG